MKKQKKSAPEAKPIGSEILVNVLLDRSGSMSSCQATTIDGYNEYIKGLKADTKTKYSVSLTQFDAPAADPELTVTYLNKPLEEVPVLTTKEYEPRGMTPLYDAIGEVLRRVADISKGRPVLDVILTDGMENASREFTQASIKALIKQKENEGHTFVFLGANIDSYTAGQSIGIAAKNIANYSPGNEVNAFANLAHSTCAYSAMRSATGSSMQSFDEAFLDDKQRSQMMGQPGTITPTTTTTVPPSGGTAVPPFRPQRKWAVKQ